MCASALQGVLQCIARCACVLSFGSGVCLSIAISCVPLHCKLCVALHSYNVVMCGSGVTALVVVPRITYTKAKNAPYRLE